MKSKKSPLVKTTEDFAARTTVHGIGYVFDPSLSFFDRMFWLAVNSPTTKVFIIFGIIPGGFNIFGAGRLSDQPEPEGVEGGAGRDKACGSWANIFLTFGKRFLIVIDQVVTTLKNTAHPVAKVFHFSIINTAMIIVHKSL